MISLADQIEEWSQNVFWKREVSEFSPWFIKMKIKYYLPRTFILLTALLNFEYKIHNPLLSDREKG